MLLKYLVGLTYSGLKKDGVPGLHSINQKETLILDFCRILLYHNLTDPAPKSGIELYRLLVYSQAVSPGFIREILSLEYSDCP